MDNKGAVIRLQMDETLAGLTGKLGKLEHQVSATVETVKDSVNTVRDSLDLKLQVRQRPWAFVAGAAAVGFLGGYRSRSHSSPNGARVNAPPAHGPSAERSQPSTNDDANASDGARRAPAAVPGWLESLGDKFQPEIAELKGIVVGTLIGIAREIITNHLPKPSARTAGGPSNGPINMQHRPVADDE